MKKIISVSAGLLFLSSSLAFGASNVKGVAIVEKSAVQDAANVAVDIGNTSDMDSIQMKNADVKGVAIEKSAVQDAANVAVDMGNTSNMDLIQMKNADVKGVAIEKSAVQDAANVAVDMGNKANIGSVVVE